VYLKSCKLCGYIIWRPLLVTVIKNKEFLRTFFSTHTVFVVGALKEYYALCCLEGSRATKALFGCQCWNTVPIFSVYKV
jgi:hypothetical protein